MRDETVARSYAEALFEVAQRHEGLEVFGEGIAAVATLLDENPVFAQFIETPRIDAAHKKAVVRKAFEDQLPQSLVHFLLVTIDKRRQRLLREMAREFAALVDEHHNRAHVEVTLARPLDDTSMERLAERFTDLLGKTAIPHARVKPEILGGVIMRSGDTIYDGSLRRRLDRMRRRLVAAGTASAGAAGE